VRNIIALLGGSELVVLEATTKMQSPARRHYQAIADAERIYGNNDVRVAKAYLELRSYYRAFKDIGGMRDCSRRLKEIANKNASVPMVLPELKKYRSR
jgi:predicted Ser/Thr protein kinase